MKLNREIYRNEVIASVTLTTLRAPPVEVPNPFTIWQSFIPCPFTEQFSCTLLGYKVGLLSRCCPIGKALGVVNNRYQTWVL